MAKFKVGNERQSTSNNWKGGEHINSQGYVLVYCPEHPYCDDRGYVRKHRIVMERKIGRILKPTERVHHINRIKTDNKIKNLELFKSEKEHQSSHPHKYDKFVYRGREKEYALEYYYKNREKIIKRKLELGVIKKRGELRCFT